MNEVTLWSMDCKVQTLSTIKATVFPNLNMVCLHMFLQNRRTEECGRAVGAAEGRTKERGKPAMVEKVVTEGYLVMVINDGEGG